MATDRLKLENLILEVEQLGKTCGIYCQGRGVMKLEKINRLFAAYSNTPATPVKSTEEKQIEQVAAKAQEAVTVASDFGSSAVGRTQTDPAKLARISEQVRSGTYEIDTTKVAKAFIRDVVA